ncbi:DUF4097 family beta strand repeat-containing protein [Leifsonia aquatica]|uniref:DUF4097 domain-containing protein n=2 Tax=Leifsonia aquatica TaxID=144185 RepID=U2R6V5_LEIAQ|nr:DUF4097 family beta strand repeat-containing protein [Leifsonia aquatica]ERK70945.1 hypothetical protein N136_02712 [Leifsonia aquatica ATCC 14665]MBB2968689.1 DUF4097 and DUF4098 domain-containing protein YvlB [Leifsonia aquatica]
MAQEKWLVQPGESRTIDVELVRTLKIGFIGGQIDVIAHDEPGARVEVHSVQGRDLKITIDGDRLEIDHPQLRWDNFIEVFKSMRSNAKADVSVLVPRDVALKFGVVSATALISGLHTDARLSTVSGDVVADGLVGDIELNSVSGELSVRDHSGRINAHTVSGDVTVSGSIRKLAVDGVSGDVMADISGTPDEIAINTVSGDSTIRIPEAIGARYRANTVSGRVQLDNVVIVGSVGKGYTGTAGSLDGSWVDINVNSVSGAVSVLRGPSASQESARQGGEGASA